MGPYEAARHIPGVSGHELPYAYHHISDTCVALFTHWLVGRGTGEARSAGVSLAEHGRQPVPSRRRPRCEGGRGRGGH
ncbi:hypothetical protein JOF35_008366 [Streptomyces demainii]|uniref:Uncharacterized protein n=1 Tax=Streptomyces demainii TaxID=588122 RepID=A0ABT9L5S4_9ACTN|nr:hypothetical protein [Streptomyces demainii]